MAIALTLIHILICFFLVVVVLLQSGKAADLAGAFGGMGSQTAFGPRGSATILSQATTIAAGLFMVTSLVLAIMATRGSGVGSTVLDKQPARAQQSAPGAGKGQPAVPAVPGVPTPKPSVTLTEEGTGASRTIPLDIPPAPGPGQPQAPVQQPAPKPATPPKK